MPWINVEVVEIAGRSSNPDGDRGMYRRIFRDRFVSLQAFDGILITLQKAEHMIEGTIFEHEHHNMFDLLKSSWHLLLSC